jgi:hypothetical protein
MQALFFWEGRGRERAVTLGLALTFAGLSSRLYRHDQISLRDRSQVVYSALFTWFHKVFCCILLE